MWSIHGDVVHATQDFATVAGYIEKPLPFTMHRGDALHLVIAGAEMYDLWAGGRAFDSPKPLAEARADVPPGVYTIRFYFPNGKTHFAVHNVTFDRSAKIKRPQIKSDEHR